MSNTGEKFERLDYNTFLSVLANYKSTSSNSKLCFILGAGASVMSGIPSGGTFAKKWRDELLADPNRKTKIQAFIDKHTITNANVGEFYCELYDLRFEGAKWQGIEYLNKEMKGREPSYGYTVLSQILTHSNSNIVITTNFDNLVEKSLYIYTEKQPLMLGHEMMAAFAKESPDTPLIIKIHRDLFFKPFNTEDETADLQKSWKGALERLLANRIAIVIGYGGNDGSLMKFLNNISGPEEIYWCDRSEPNAKVLGLLNNKGVTAHYIEINGFDELMFDISNAWKLERLNDEIIEVAKDRAEVYRKKVEDLTSRLSKEGSPEQQERVKQFVENPKSWWDYELKVRATENKDKKEKIYNEGLKSFPNSPELNGNYAFFLQYTHKDYDAAERYYKKALELDPNQANSNNNYAVFLLYIRKDYDAAEKYYKKALELEPNQANIIVNYASFIQFILKGYDTAEKKYEKALELEPDDADYNGNYASFLLAQGKKDTAKPYLNKAFEKCTENQLQIELWFYRYAHYLEYFEEAHKKLIELIEQGIRSPYWNFEDNIKQAEKDGHPNVKELKRLAKIITEVKI